MAEGQETAGAPKDAAWATAREADERWADALTAHRMAPPDPGFRSRLGELAAAAAAQAQALRQSAEAGLEWAPIPQSKRSKPPYELRRGTGRRGPPELWERFDEAVVELNESGAGSDVYRVAAAFAQVADAADALVDEFGATP